MKHPLDILSHHEQLHPCSCVAWGIELILKMHEKIQLADYPLQNGNNPTGWGFGTDAQQLLLTYGIQAHDDSLELPDFEATVSKQIQAGSYTIFSVPDSVSIDYAANTARFMCHVWVAVSDSPHEYRSRAYDVSEILRPLPLAAVYQAVRAQLLPDYRIHHLLHW